VICLVRASAHTAARRRLVQSGVRLRPPGNLCGLCNGHLRIAQQVSHFHEARSRIHRHAVQQGVAIYIVDENSRVRRQRP
jgi:hypothetical protein